MNISRHQSYKLNVERRPKFEDLIASKASSRIGVMEVDVKRNKNNHPDLDCVRNYPKAMPITPANLHKKFNFNDFDGMELCINYIISAFMKFDQNIQIEYICYTF